MGAGVEKINDKKVPEKLEEEPKEKRFVLVLPQFTSILRNFVEKKIATVWR